MYVRGVVVESMLYTVICSACCVVLCCVGLGLLRFEANAADYSVLC